MKTALWLALALALLAVLYFLPSVDFAAGQSLEDTVRDSEGGQMPSQEEFTRRGGEATHVLPAVSEPAQSERALPDSTPSMKEGERDSDPRGADVPGDQHPTPPQAPDARGLGQLLAPPTIYAFFGWSADDRFLGGKTFDTAEECGANREHDRARYPRVQFSLCAMLWAERETL